jgi:hypothetical protein
MECVKKALVKLICTNLLSSEMLLVRYAKFEEISKWTIKMQYCDKKLLFYIYWIKI